MTKSTSRRGHWFRCSQFEFLEFRRFLDGGGMDAPDDLVEPKRIVGGDISDPGKWPWVVSLQNESGHVCGGTLIEADAIITAAHCFIGGGENVKAVLARNDLTQDTGEEIPVAEIFNHPNYDPFSEDSDIAVVLLEAASSVQPISPISGDRLELAAPGVDATILGWGSIVEGGPIVTRLREITVPVVSNEVANRPKSYDGSITDNMLAAGFEQGGKDSCSGDSGGPLVVEDSDGEFYLAGVVSWGDGCAAPLKFGINTRVSAFTEWIDGIVNVNSQGVVSFSRNQFSVFDEAKMSVHDGDLEGLERVDVIVDTDTGDQETVTLAATGGGRFRGQISLNGSELSPGNDVLNVIGGEQIRVSYHDENHAAGESAVVVDSAEIILDDFGNQADDATAIGIPSTTAGNLEISEDVDWFAFQARDDRSYKISVVLNGSLDDSLLTVFDSDGETSLAFDDDGGKGFASELVFRTGIPGTKYIEVSGYTTSVGTYSLEIIEIETVNDDHGDDATSATPVNVPTTITGSVEFPKDIDWFTFDAVAGTTYEFETEVGSLDDTVLRLLDTDGVTVLAQNDDIDALRLHSRISWTADASGARYLEVSGFENEQGSYKLHAKITSDDHADSFELATSVDIPFSAIGLIEAADDVDWFSFEARSGLAYQFELQIETPAVIRLYGRDGAMLLEEKRAENRMARVLWLVENDGTHFFSVTSSHVGNYEIHASIPTGDSNLDGRFDSTDLISAFIAGEYEDDVLGNSTWAEGDWNGDGDFNSTDLVVAFLHDNYVSDATGMKHFDKRAVAKGPNAADVEIAFAAGVRYDLWDDRTANTGGPDDYAFCIQSGTSLREVIHLAERGATLTRFKLTLFNGLF